MRSFGFVFLAICSTFLVAAQSTQQPPQSARQALIEMFMGKGADDFVKHLPDEARKSLIHKNDTAEVSIALRASSIARELSSQSGGHVETFDAGPNILVREDPDGHEKLEVAVEQDSLIGEEEDIELSVHVSKDGVPQALPVIPRIIFTLKQEKEVWRVTEVTVAAHLPLTDPDYLSGLRKQQNESNESAAMGRIYMIAQTEITYAADHPEIGYTCTLSNLSPQSGQAESLSASSMANPESNGYRFTLTGCEGAPASKYRLTAVPLDQDAEMKTFCVDESRKLRSLPADKKSNCFSQGEMMNVVGPTAQPD